MPQDLWCLLPRDSALLLLHACSGVFGQAHAHPGPTPSDASVSPLRRQQVKGLGQLTPSCRS